jgi:hypothetical protein
MSLVPGSRFGVFLWDCGAGSCRRTPQHVSESRTVHNPRPCGVNNFGSVIGEESAKRAIIPSRLSRTWRLLIQAPSGLDA